MSETLQLPQQAVAQAPVRPPMAETPYRLLGLLVLLSTFGGFGTWSALAPLDSAIISSGRVQVESHRKTIQHLEGGIVKQIHVKEADVVEPGQLLVTLSDVMPRAQLEIAQVQYIESLGLEARLKAERRDADTIHFPPELLERRDEPEIAELIAGQTELFDTRRNARLQERDILTKRVEQLKEQIAGFQARVRSEQRRIESYRTEIKEWRSLYEEQMADKLRLLQMGRELAQLEGDQAAHRAEIARFKIQIGETESQIVLRRESHLSEVAAQLRETVVRIADLRTRIVALEDTLSRTEIYSPVRGTVVGFNVHTIGAVISPGTPILDIVPLTRDLVVEAFVRPVDIDNLHVGMTADIRFSAFDTRHTHVIPGSVTTISADALEDPNTGGSFYKAEVQLTAEGLERLDEYDFQLLPGMPAEVIVKTGSRTLMDYFVKPFSDMLARAFREQ